LGDRKGIRPAKKLRVGLLVVTFDWRYVHFIAHIITITSIILSTNKTDNSGSPGKMAVKMEGEEVQYLTNWTCTTLDIWYKK